MILEPSELIADLVAGVLLLEELDHLDRAVVAVLRAPPGEP
jgi:hypothetical protein